MKELCFVIVILLSMVLGFSGCAQSSSSSDVSVVIEYYSDEEFDMSAEDAMEIFQDHYPDIQIYVVRLESEAYYVEGREGDALYKMLISAIDGEILMDEVV
ncbi:PepSY domain-containing protein [Ruminococcaceae bacterium OttesenSCG-928-I18]|nr:PepSY domain-containing protein [Ruminococcaceae bacterium OttesenSCG-928-I18]